MRDFPINSQDHYLYDPQKEYGITLIELLITLFLFSVLFFFAHQSYQNFQRTMNEEILLATFMQQLKMAKTLASIENRALTLCGTLNGVTCVSAQEKKWQGWLLFYDDHATFTPDKETIIAYQAPRELLEKGFYLKTTNNIGGGINFKSRREYAYGMARSLANGRIYLCRPPDKALKNQLFYTIIINVYGYSRLAHKKGACP